MLQLGEPPAPAAGRAFALWELGFRPFYLLASIYAALAVALWAGEYAGLLPAFLRRDPVRHAHEMLFGYTLAVIAGFLFTAVRNWTGQPTPRGRPLMACAALWLAGRVLAYTDWDLAAALVSAAFPLAVAAGIGVPLARSGNRRNYFFVALLAALALVAAAVHLALLQVLPAPGLLPMQVALDLVLFIMAVMGGRVIPMFTANGVPGTDARRVPAVERISLGLLLVLLATDVLAAYRDVPPQVFVVLALAAAAAHGLRLALWQPWRTLHTPLVWILHAGYAWIVVHLVLRALAAPGLVSMALAVHALTVGAIGGLTIGMMVRTARGHTGRPLLPDRWERACFVLVQVAALLRVGGGLLTVEHYVATVLAAAAFWCAGFALYAARYWPILSRARVDGRPG